MFALRESIPNRGIVCSKVCLKGGFHETTNIDEIDHRYVTISQQVIQTCRHQPMEIGAVLADVLFHN